MESYNVYSLFVWALLLIKIIHVLVWTKILFLFIVWIYYSLFIHSLVDEHLSCFNFWLLHIKNRCPKTIIQKESCTTMFIAALFTIARTWKQPKCPSTDECIKKMRYIYKMEYHSAIKRNKIELFVLRWMDLESVLQSEVSQKEKNKYRMLTHIYGI